MTRIDDIDDMATLRAHIDAVDQRLIALFAERHALIDQAAKIKARESLPARIDDRVEEVVANVRRNAVSAGLDGALFEALWRQLVDAAIEQEEQHLKGNGGNV